MSKAVISLDEEEQTKLEQVIMDHDEPGAFELLHEIRMKVRTYLDPRCGVDKLRKPFK